MKKTTIIALLLTLAAVGCTKKKVVPTNVGLDGNTYSDSYEREAALGAMNQLAGYNRYESVKENTLQRYHMVVLDKDNGEFVAWNLAGFRVGMTGQTAYDQIDNDGIYEDLDKKFGGFYYDDPSDTLFSEVATAKKDLEAMGASIESIETADLASIYTVNFGLSEERAVEVAKLTKTYNSISNKRSLTAKEKDVFSKKLLGMDYKQVNKAMRNGSDYEVLLEKASELNGVSPEEVSDILKQIL